MLFSVVIALIFLYGFNAALVLTAYLNWNVPCDQPFTAYLLSFGLLGLVRA